MDFYGITNKGSFVIEKIATLSAWGASDEGRIVYAEDVNTLYYGTDTKWQALGGGGTTRDIAQATHGFSAGNVLRYNSGTSLYVKAQADSISNAEVVGIVSASVSAGVFTLLNCGYITGLSGLTAGSVHFLSETVAGALTTTEPELGNSVNKPLLIADSTTSGYFFNFRGVENADSSVSYYIDFTNADITTGILTVNHNLSVKYALPVIWDNNSNVIQPDSYTAVTANQMTVDLTSYGAITGTWHISVLSTGTTITYPITVANGGLGKVNTPSLGKVLEGDGTNFTANYRPLQNQLTNTQWMACSGSTVENVGAAICDDNCNSDLTANWTKEATGVLTYNVANLYQYKTNAANVSAYLHDRPVTAGKLYQVRCQIRDSAISPTDVRFMFSDGTTQFSQNIDPGAAFAYFTAVFEAATTTATAVFGINALTTFGNAYGIEIDNFTVYEVTPGYVAAGNLACDGWVKSGTNDLWREHSGSNTKNGSFYALRMYGTAGNWIKWPSNETELTHLAKFAGRTIAIGAWIKTSSASHARVFLYDGATVTYSSYHTGGGAFEWLECTATMATSPSTVYVGIIGDLATTNMYVSQPMLVFGSSIGEGNYQPIPNEVIALESSTSVDVLFSYAPTSGYTTINLEAVTNGMISKGIKGMYGYGYATNSAINKYLIFTRGTGGGPYSIYIQSQIAAVGVSYAGYIVCDSNGNFTVWAEDANWSSVRLSISAVQL